MKSNLRILPLVLVATFASCAPVKSEQMSKNAMDEDEILETQKVEWPLVLSQIEERYLVFFYSETCTHCHEIMRDVLSFSHAEITKTYFLDIKKSEIKIPIRNDIDKTVGVSSVDDLFIAGTPTIVEVKEGEVNANVAGKDECLTFLNEQRLTYK